MSHTTAEKLLLYGFHAHNMGWDTLRITQGMLYNARELQRNIAARINLRKGMP